MSMLTRVSRRDLAEFVVLTDARSLVPLGASVAAAADIVERHCAGPVALFTAGRPLPELSAPNPEAKKFYDTYPFPLSPSNKEWRAAVIELARQTDKPIVLASSCFVYALKEEPAVHPHVVMLLGTPDRPGEKGKAHLALTPPFVDVTYTDNYWFPEDPQVIRDITTRTVATQALRATSNHERETLRKHPEVVESHGDAAARFAYGALPYALLARHESQAGRAVAVVWSGNPVTAQATLISVESLWPAEAATTAFKQESRVFPRRRWPARAYVRVFTDGRVPESFLDELAVLIKKHRVVQEGEIRVLAPEGAEWQPQDFRSPSDVDGDAAPVRTLLLPRRAPSSTGYQDIQYNAKPRR